MSASAADDDRGPAPADPWADVGLVVVHGIGEQARGATLLDWAEPITRRLDEIAVGVDVVRSQIVDAERSEVRLLVRLRGNRECRMIISEARWADAFLTVSASGVLAWGLRFSVRALLRLGSHLRRTVNMVASRGTARADRLAAITESVEDRIPRWLPFLGGQRILTGLVLVGGLLLAGAVLVGGLGLAAVFGPLALLSITVGTLLLAALAKVPVLGRRVHAVLAGLVLTVGDATSWTERPLRAAAMRDRVRDAIVEIDAPKVVVLGHSQGAAVAAEAVLGLGAPEDGRVAMLVTVGGAVSLLRRPRWSARSHDPIPGAVARWSARRELGWANLWATWDPVPSGPVTDEDGDATLRWDEMYPAPPEPVKSAQPAPGPPIPTWVVPAQPVPVRPVPTWVNPSPPPTVSIAGVMPRQPSPIGPGLSPDFLKFLEDVVRDAGNPDDDARVGRSELALLGLGEDESEGHQPGAASVAGPAEWAVHNRASILADHTTYTTNVSQVIDPLARLLVDVGGHGAALPDPKPEAAEAHVNAVRMLGAMRLSALATSVVGLATLTSRGIDVPILDWLVRAVRPLSSGTADGLSWLQQQSWQGYAQFVVASALVAAVLIAVGSGLWNRWHQAYSWVNSRGVSVLGWAFFTYYALTVLTPTALVAAQVDQAIGWWVWPIAAGVAIGVIVAPTVGPRPQPLAGRRKRPRGPATDQTPAGPAAHG